MAHHRPRHEGSDRKCAAASRLRISQAVNAAVRSGASIRRCFKIFGGGTTNMALDGEDEWQRDTEHPSTNALPGFLESDLRRGMIVVRRAALECGSGQAVPPEVVSELD